MEWYKLERQGPDLVISSFENGNGGDIKTMSLPIEKIPTMIDYIKTQFSFIKKNIVEVEAINMTVSFMDLTAFIEKIEVSVSAQKDEDENKYEVYGSVYLYDEETEYVARLGFYSGEENIFINDLERIYQNSEVEVIEYNG